VEAISVRDLDFAWEDGSGKTTLLHLMAGILAPRRGSVVTDGVELSALGDAERRAFRVARVGLVFQEFELLEYLSVLDNVLLPYRIHPGLPLVPGVRSRALALTERMGIGDHLRRRPRHLSQGERQRAAVCRALLPEPPLLLADEPTGNLDPANKARVLDLLFEEVDLFEEVERRGTTLVAVTHDHELLDRFGRVVDFKIFGAGEVEA
jgi:ABC-type lipoprotein export system ATPase subunit